jgi:hypothetical protein
MKIFFLACITAAVIATGAAFLLNTIQKDSKIAYTTSGARI